jgi:hypothetical protein
MAKLSCFLSYNFQSTYESKEKQYLAKISGQNFCPWIRIRIKIKVWIRIRKEILRIHKTVRLYSRVVDPDPDPDWIRIQRLCESGSVLGIRIPDPDPGARKLRNINVKMHFLVIFKKIYHYKSIK